MKKVNCIQYQIVLTHGVKLNKSKRFCRIMKGSKTYVKNGSSYFTVETHIRHLVETAIGETLLVETQLIYGVGKKMHLFHIMKNKDNVITATGEHLLIHVSLKTRSSSEPSSDVQDRLNSIFSKHAKLPSPKGLGNAINTIGTN